MFVCIKQKKSGKAYASLEFNKMRDEKFTISFDVLIMSKLTKFNIRGLNSIDTIFNINLSRLLVHNELYFKWVPVVFEVNFKESNVKVRIYRKHVSTIKINSKHKCISTLQIVINNNTPLGLVCISKIKVSSRNKEFYLTFKEQKISNSNVDVYYIDEPFIFNWKRNSKIIELSLPKGPAGTNSYRDPMVAHDEKGFTVRLNGFFYMIPSNISVGISGMSYKNRATLLRSKNLVDWEVITDLTTYKNLRVKNFVPTRADLMYDHSKRKLYALMELWDKNNNQYYSLFRVNEIENPNIWRLEAGLSNKVDGGVPYLVRNPKTKRLEAWAEHTPDKEHNYVVSKLEIVNKHFGPIKIVYDMRKYGVEIPNPSVIHSKVGTLITANPIPSYCSRNNKGKRIMFIEKLISRLLYKFLSISYKPKFSCGLPNGLWSVVAIPFDDGMIVPLRYGTWNDTENLRHETPRVISTERMLRDGKLFLAWWEGSPYSGNYKNKLLVYNNPNIESIPDVSV